MNKLSLLTYLVADYDEAIAWFRDCLDFHLMEDTPQDGKRWVVMAPHKTAETAFLLACAVGEQIEQIGNSAAGRVGYFLETDDFTKKHSAMVAAGVIFEENPRVEPYGTVAVFNDLYGNRWDLLQRT